MRTRKLQMMEKIIRDLRRKKNASNDSTARKLSVQIMSNIGRSGRETSINGKLVYAQVAFCSLIHFYKRQAKLSLPRAAMKSAMRSIESHLVSFACSLLY